MNWNSSNIEFTRFFGRKGGEGIGCCAIDLIQGFYTDPDDKCKTFLTEGDSGNPIVYKGRSCYLGNTNKEVFENYLRIGTFHKDDLPNRIFLAALSETQVSCDAGKKWLAILKENHFEFIRATDNSVYTGSDPSEKTLKQPVYLFGLFRNISKSALDDPFQPPSSWLELPEPTMTPKELWDSRKTVLLLEDPKEETTNPFGMSEMPVEAHTVSLNPELTPTPS